MAQEGFLIKQEKYLEAGIHIGTKLRVIDMQRFIYRTRNDGLYVLDLRKVDERIRLAGRMLTGFAPADILVVASRAYSTLAAKRFAETTGAQVIAGRFVPGRFTNVSRADFVEPKLVIVCDPKGERQAVVECGRMGLPTLGLCDTDNFTMFIDWVIPCNNKGRRSLALIFWLLAREMAMTSGKITAYDDFKPTLEEFEAPPVEPVAPVEGAVAPASAAAEAPVSQAPVVESESTPSAKDARAEVKEAEDEATRVGSGEPTVRHRPEGPMSEAAEKKPAAKKTSKAKKKKADGTDDDSKDEDSDDEGEKKKAE